MSDADVPIDILEAMATARSFHRYRFDPIPEEDLGRIMWAGTRAPSGTNRQPFRFIVLRDTEGGREARALLADGFRRGWSHKIGAEGWKKQGDDTRSTRRTRSMAAMQQFVDDFDKIPAIVLACMHRYREPHHGEGASVFPACQNILLAARSLGYGACFSGWHSVVEDELRALLAIPDDVVISLTITIGLPEGKFGPVRRFPASELVFEDRWENGARWVVDPPGSAFSRSRMKSAASYKVE